MTERGGTAEDFAQLFGAEPAGPEPTDEHVAEAAEVEEETAQLGAPPTEDDDGSQFLGQLFEPKRGEVEFIRSIHGDGTP